MKEIEDIHRPFIAWLTERQIPYIYHRGDRKSGIHSGHPDFTILWMRRQMMIECKTPGGRLSDLQVKRIDFLRRNGNVVEIARNVDECVEAVKSILCEGKPVQDSGGSCNWPLKECFRDLRTAVSQIDKDAESINRDMQALKTCDLTMDLPVNGSGEHLFIGELFGVAKVFRGSGKPGDMATLVRTATPSDIATLPRG